MLDIVLLGTIITLPLICNLISILQGLCTYAPLEYQTPDVQFESIRQNEARRTGEI